MSGKSELVSLSGIRKSYGEKNVLGGFSLNVSEGDFIGVKGKSGSGKSTILNIVGLIDRPDSGGHLFLGEDMTVAADSRLSLLRGDFIGFIYQSYNLLPKLTVRENVLLPYLYGRKPLTRLVMQRLDFLAEWTGMTGLLDQPCDTLSGGEKQRAAFSRALIKDPVMILADEPTGNLDSDNKRTLFGLLSKMNSKGKTVILVTHDEECFSMCDRKIIISGGTTHDMV